MSEWNFFSNHAHVLFMLSINEHITVRELSLEVGITERFAHKIISELSEGGYISIKKDGRQNHYKVNSKKKLRHPIESHINIGKLISLISNQK
ncbi:MAG: hypothetical protein N4A33_01830 [Bacteriovoracaceae bacterium]|jgi:predicted transcriptional regulator|nr:hypothetical protein [Bacteriovoracaceae bacterium]